MTPAKIPIILSSGSLYNFDVDSTMGFAADAGFAGLELMVDWRTETYRLKRLERLMIRHKLPILAVHSPFSSTWLQGWPDDPVAKIKRSVNLAESLGARTVVVHPPARWIRVQAVLRRPDQTQKLSVPLPLAGLGRLGRWLLNDLPQFQKTTGVKIAIENMPGRPFGPLTLKPHHFASPAELNAFQYLTLDTTHVGTYRTDLLAFYGAVRRRLAHVHLSNYNGREHQRLDDGVLPLSDFVAQLARDNFGGLISVEFSPFSLQAQSETLLKQHLQASLSFCQRALAAEVEPP